MTAILKGLKAACCVSLAVQSTAWYLLTWHRTPPRVFSSRNSANRQTTQRGTFHGCCHLVKKLCRTVDFRTITPCSLVGGTNLTKKNTAFVFTFGRRENTVGREAGPPRTVVRIQTKLIRQDRRWGHPAAHSMGTGVPSGRNRGRGALTDSSPTHASHYLYFPPT